MPFKDFVPKVQEMTRERMKTGRRSVTMKIAAIATAAVTSVGFGGSMYELALSANASGAASTLQYDHLGLSAKQANADIRAYHETSRHDDVLALDFFLGSMILDTAAISAFELRHRRLSNPDRRPDGHRLLGIHALQYRALDGLSGAVESIIHNSHHAIDMLAANKDPYADARREPPYDKPPQPPEPRGYL